MTRIDADIDRDESPEPSGDSLLFDPFPVERINPVSGYERRPGA